MQAESIDHLKLSGVQMPMTSLGIWYLDPESSFDEAAFTVASVHLKNLGW